MGSVESVRFPPKAESNFLPNLFLFWERPRKCSEAQFKSKAISWVEAKPVSH